MQHGTAVVAEPVRNPARRRDVPDVPLRSRDVEQVLAVEVGLRRGDELHLEAARVEARLQGLCDARAGVGRRIEELDREAVLVAGLREERLRLRRVAVAAVVRIRVEVLDVADVAREDDLVRGRGDLRAAVDLHDRVLVHGVVGRLAHEQLLERPRVLVEREVRLQRDVVRARRPEHEARVVILEQ